MVGWISRQTGHRRRAAGAAILLRVAAFAVAVLADFLLLLYVLTLLPGVEPPRRRLVVAALIGAVGFELLKLLLSGYMQGVAAKSMYGAFGVPVALLLWINFTAKLVLFCAAWTATPSKGATRTSVRVTERVRRRRYQIRQRPAAVDQERGRREQHQRTAGDGERDSRCRRSRPPRPSRCRRRARTSSPAAARLAPVAFAPG